MAKSAIILASGGLDSGVTAYYAKKKSLLLDILIMLKTPWAMVSGKGAR